MNRLHFSRRINIQNQIDSVFQERLKTIANSKTHPIQKKFQIHRTIIILKMKWYHPLIFRTHFAKMKNNQVTSNQLKTSLIWVSAKLS